MPDELRRSPRRHLVYYLPVYRRPEGTLLGRLGDLTEDGFMLMCDEAVALDSEHAVRIQSESDLSAVDHVDVVARCRWCRPQEGGAFDVGFEFQDQRLATARAIRALIEEIGFNDR